MSLELGLLALKAFLPKRKGATNVTEGRKWKKGVPSIPRSQLKKPPTGKRYEGRIPGKNVKPPSRPKFKVR